MLDVLADFSNEDIFYLSYFERAQNAEKVSIGITSQCITGTAIQIHLCKSNGSPQLTEMPLLPKSDTDLAFRRKGVNDLWNVHLHAGNGCLK